MWLRSTLNSGDTTIGPLDHPLSYLLWLLKIESAIVLCTKDLPQRVPRDAVTPTNIRPLRPEAVSLRVPVYSISNPFRTAVS